ncbi:MAG: hypothetical protein J5830_04210 [Clostridia bacterium]|nr:hypothetical protein [Clostridia bacterium]
MRKIVLVTVMLLIAVFVLASCGDCKHEDVVVDPAVAPTCTETGLTEGRHCAKCGAVIAAQETVPAAGHREEAVEARPATCTEAGHTEGVRCSVCGQTLSGMEVIPATGHTEEKVDGKPATCTEAGYAEGVICSVCGEKISGCDEIPATGHTVVEYEGKPATCTEAGTLGGSFCSVCGETLSGMEVIPATGHTEEVIPGREATATSAGLTEGVKCSVCGEILVAQEEIPALMNLTKPKSAEIESFKNSALSAALNMKPFTDGNTIDPKEAVKAYYYAVIDPWPDYGEDDGWKPAEYENIPQKFQHLMIMSNVFTKSVPISRIVAFFNADNMNFSGISYYEFEDGVAAVTYNSKSKTMDYYACEVGIGGPGWEDIELEPYEVSYKKNSTSEYTYTAKQYFKDKPSDMTGVSKTTIYILKWEEEGWSGDDTFTFTESQYKRQLESGVFDEGEYGEGSYTVTKGTGYVRTWTVSAVHADGSFRIVSITQ